MPKACIVPNCWKTFKNNSEKCSVFKVPQDEELRKKWEMAIPGIGELKTSQHVCERHFEPGSIVRNLVKRGPDGQILIDIPYKRPRLLETVVPSIFGNSVPAHRKDTDKENKSPDAVEVAVTGVGCEVKKTAVLTSVENQPDAVKTFFDQSYTEEDMDTNEESANETHHTNCLADETSLPSELDITSEDLRFKISVTSDSQIVFTTTNGDCTVSLPNFWTICKSSTQPNLLSVSQIATNGDVAAIRKGIVIDENRNIKYAIHGKALNHPVLPQQLEDPENLPRIIKDFDVLRICDGLGETNTTIAEAGTIYRDTMNMYRSTMCMLIGGKKTCNFCARLRKTLRQKDFRYTTRSRIKRFSTPSNPLDEKKLKCMRLKINRERRAKNRRTRRIRILTEVLKQKQDEFVAIKEHLLEERCSKFKVPEAQKTALQEILAAAKLKDLRGRRYTKNWIMLCMLMNIRSPSCYEFLRKNQILPLPCSRTVRNYFSLIDSKCGFDDKFFELLKLKFESKEPMQRHGMLVCDEINLRKSVSVSAKNLTYSGLTDFGPEGPVATNADDLATHGLVLLFQPIADKFTQPIAVFASKNPVKGEELAKLMVKAIILLEQCGASIHGIISDGAHTNTKMGTLLGVNRTIDSIKPWFTHPLDDERRVFVFSDVPHLMKNVRNRLHNKGKLRINRDEGHVEWRYFQNLLDTDTRLVGNLRVCPKISKRHVDPDNTSKMRVRLATQIFSNSVADGLKFYRDQKYAGFSGCEETIGFCKRLNDLFDALNRKMPNQGLTPDSNDFKILQSSADWLDNWERAMLRGDITSDEFLTPDTASGLRLSLHSTMGLCRYLIDKYNFQYILSGKINQDNLEKFFGTIRQASGSNDHPSCSTFLQLYQLLSVYSVIKPPIYGNCTVSDRKPPEILVSVDDLIKIYGRTESKTSELAKKLQTKLDELIEYEDWEIDELQDHDYSLPQVLDCVVYYVTGYLCKQVLRRYGGCEECQNAIRRRSEYSCSASKLVDEKSRGRLIHANAHFFKLVSHVESCFAKHAHEKHVFDLTVEEVLSTYNFTFPCVQHASEILSYSIFYYIRMRMRQFTYQQNQKQQKRFVVKNKLAKLTNQ